MVLEALQGGKMLLRPTARPVGVIALLVCHQNDDIRRPREVDISLSDGWSAEAAWKAGHACKSGSCLQQSASCS